MINNISWADYCLALGTFLAIYYLLVLFFYFRKDISQTMSARNDGASFYDASVRQSHKNEQLSSDNLAVPIEDLNLLETKSANSLQYLSDEIEAFFNQVNGANTSKGRLIDSLKRIIFKHSQNIENRQRLVVNYHLRMNCIKYCSINLLEEEIDLMWQD